MLPGAEVAPHASPRSGRKPLHIATEGPLGLPRRRYCLRHEMRFTTSYHTQFPQYLRARFPIPIRLSYWALHRFHGARGALHGQHRLGAPRTGRSRGFENLASWRRGVDTELFKPGTRIS